MNNQDGSLFQQQAMKAPPYTKHLDLDDPEVWVAIGEGAWTFAKRNRNCLVLPPGEQPERFRWPVRDREVVIWQTTAGQALLRRTAQAIVGYAPKSVDAFRCDCARFERGLRVHVRFDWRSAA